MQNATSLKTIRRAAPLMLGLLLAQGAVAGSDGRTTDQVIAYGLPALGGAIALMQHDEAGLWMLAKTVGTTALTTEVLKQATNDTAWGTRPNGDDKSFPSGHTSSACAGAAFIGQRYGWRYGSAAMLPAAYVGWSRVEQDLHHVRDVVAGCAIGLASALYFTQPIAGSTVTPFFDRKVIGVQMRSVW